MAGPAVNLLIQIRDGIRGLSTRLAAALAPGRGGTRGQAPAGRAGRRTPAAGGPGTGGPQPPSRLRQQWGATQGLFSAAGAFVPELGRIGALLGNLQRLFDAIQAFGQAFGPAQAPPILKALRVPRSQIPFPARVAPASALRPPKALSVPRSQMPFPARVPPPPRGRAAKAPPPAVNPPTVPVPPATPVAPPPPPAIPAAPPPATPIPVAPATPAVAAPATPSVPVASTPPAPQVLSDAERAQLVKLLGVQGAALFEQGLVAQAAQAPGPPPPAVPPPVTIPAPAPPAVTPQPAVPSPPAAAPTPQTPAAPAGPLPQPATPALPAAPTPQVPPVAETPAGPPAPEFFREEYLGLKPDAALRRAQNAALAAGRATAAASRAGRAVADYVLEHGTSPETVYKREALRHTAAGLPPERAQALARRAADRAFAARSRAVPAAGGPPATAGLFPGGGGAPGAAVPGTGAGPDLAGTLRELLEAVRGLAKATPAAPGEPPPHRAAESGPAGREAVPQARSVETPTPSPHDPADDFGAMARKLGHILEIAELLA